MNPRILEHEYVLKFIDVARSDKESYLVLEWMPLGDVETFLQAKEFQDIEPVQILHMLTSIFP